MQQQLQFPQPTMINLQNYDFIDNKPYLQNTQSNSKFYKIHLKTDLSKILTLKIYEIKSEKQIEKYQQEYEIHTLSHKNHYVVSNLKGYSILQNQKDYSFLPKNIFCLLFEFLPENLKMALNYKLKQQQSDSFSKDQIIDIAISLSSVLNSLQEKQITHQNLCIDSIFVSDDWNFRLSEFQYSFIVQDLNEKVDDVYNQYFPSEKNLNQLNSTYFKNDVFRFGLLLIEIVTLQKSNMKDQTFKDDLDKIENKLGVKFRFMLEGLLANKPSQRPTFKEIQQYLQNYLLENNKMQDNINIKQYQNSFKTIYETDGEMSQNIQLKLDSLQSFYAGLRESFQQSLIIQNKTIRNSCYLQIKDGNTNKTNFLLSYDQLQRLVTSFDSKLQQIKIQEIEIDKELKIGEGSEGEVFFKKIEYHRYMHAQLHKNLDQQQRFYGIQLTLKYMNYCNSLIVFQIEIYKIHAQSNILQLKKNPTSIPIYSWYFDISKKYPYNLDQLIHSNKLQQQDQINIAIQLIEIINTYENLPGEDYIVHGDLKLRNILLDENYNVFLNDFGFSTIFERVTRYQKYQKINSVDSQTEFIFISPEQLLEDKITVQSDIYTIGLVFYELFFKQKISHQLSLKMGLFDKQKAGSMDVDKQLIKDKLHQKIAGFIKNMTNFEPTHRPKPQTILIELLKFRKKPIQPHNLNQLYIIGINPNKQKKVNKKSDKQEFHKENNIMKNFNLFVDDQDLKKTKSMFFKKKKQDDKQNNSFNSGNIY